MTFKTSRLNSRFDKFQSILASLDRQLTRIRGEMAVSATPADVILALGETVSEAIDAVVIAEAEDATDDTLQTLFREEYGEPAFDLTSELAALRVALVAINDEIDTTFPTDASNFVLEKTKTRGPNGQIIYTVRDFSTGQTATLTTLLDNVTGLIS